MAIVQNDQGTVISLDTHVDLSSAGGLSFTLVAPGGERVTRTTNVTVSGTMIRYTAQPGEIVKPGTWSFQAHLTLGAWTGSTVPVYHTVHPDLRA